LRDVYHVVLLFGHRRTSFSFQQLINLKTAKMPPAPLARADEVIE
jgi:hypothetical protein